MDRYTIKDMEELDDIQFAIRILQDRRSKCTNFYSPLSQKLYKCIDTLTAIRNNMPPSQRELFKGYSNIK